MDGNRKTNGYQTNKNSLMYKYFLSGFKDRERTQNEPLKLHYTFSVSFYPSRVVLKFRAHIFRVQNSVFEVQLEGKSKTLPVKS